ncbi:uncharacterized protein LOC110692954 [Chenopodium quinoa]|uniref:uncharacterized protein LOC110692954 n=1 Tax=Chenopodium quinoa TaxID=63459 RepID=UPI000B78A6E9|nr:uncharacterized protein LOC110692954 [Chenopodium quinoa]
MGDGKQDVMAVNSPKGLIQQNPITQIQSEIKKLEVNVKSWLSKQSIPVEAAVVTAGGAIQGALIGGLMGTFTQDLSSSMPMQPPPGSLDPNAMASLKQAQALSGGPLVQARNFAVMTGVNVGISTVLRRIKGKEDVWSSMAAAFGSGAMFSLVSGMGGPNQVSSAVSSGAFFALAQGGIYKLGEKFSKPVVEDDPFYAKTRSLLFSLGLQSYEKNFKKGLLNDRTLPLLNDSALRDVKIPPGPRLLILDQIERDPELKERRKK